MTVRNQPLEFGAMSPVVKHRVERVRLENHFLDPGEKASAAAPTAGLEEQIRVESFELDEGAKVADPNDRLAPGD